MRRGRSEVVVLAAALLCAGRAGAVVTVFGDSFAATCSRAARAERTDAEALRLCTVALGESAIVAHDLAASYVNRATIYMHRRDWTAAIADLNQAIKIDASLGETRVDLGASYVAIGRAKEALAEIDAGLELHTEQPEKAYFNRALANEQLEDIRGAYFDYLKASELAPKWSEPKLALARFHVEPKQP